MVVMVAMVMKLSDYDEYGGDDDKGGDDSDDDDVDE